MKKQKSTKRALLMSALSLLLCLSMLVGTTFAWFTDSVTSGNNIIQSGNLDIKLEYLKDGEWVDVAGKSDILTNTLWEPGVTEVAYLRVANAGSLALKYQLGINIISEIAGVNAAGEEFKLSEYIQFGVVEGVNGKTGAYASREAAVAAVAEAKKISAGYTKAASMTANQELYLALVVWMPTTVGNEANHNGKDVPTIDLGINIFATQYTKENDSYDPDYDEDAWHPDFKVYDANDLQAAINNGKTNIVLMDNIDLNEAIVIPAPAATTFAMRTTPTPVVINLNGKTLSNPNGYVIENYGNVLITGKGTVSGLGGIRSHSGSVIIEDGNFYVASRWQDGVYQHTLKAENSTVVIKGGNFDATENGQTNAMFNASENAVITINGGNFKNVAGDLTQFDPYIFTYEKDGQLIINDGTFYGGWRFNGETATTVINGGNFTVGFDGQSFHANSTHVATVYGGTFTAGTKLAGKLDAIVADGYKAVENNGKYIVASENAVANTDELIAAINAGQTKIELIPGDYALRFTNNTSFNLNGKTIKGLGEVKLAISSSEAWYGRIQANDVTFENIHFTSTVGATGEATYNNCTFDSWTICASSNKEETYFNNCTINGCLNTSTDLSSGDVYVEDSEIAKAEYSGSMTMNFENCEIGEMIIWNANTNLTNCKVTTLDQSNVTNAVVKIDGVVQAATLDALNNAFSGSNVNVTLAAGEYKMPSSGTAGAVTITGTKDTVLDMIQGAYMENAGVTIEGVTIKTSTGYAGVGASDYAALYAENVTYINCTFVGPMRIGRDGAKFINCTFTELGNDYIWNYGNDVTFEGCTFNTAGKAILLYSDGGNEVAKVTVKNCVFNSTQGAKAGAIANQNCAAIEIHNYGNGVNLVTEGNTYDSNFSGEWRIKTYETGKTQVFVNGAEYTTIAIDGKTMTIDADRNVTVNG